MLLTLHEARQVIKVVVSSAEETKVTYSVLLKSTGSWLGSIEINISESGEQASFTGQNWIYNAVNEDGELVMRYPMRFDQYSSSNVEYLDLDRQSAVNQATLDALHYFWQSRVWQFPNYNPLTFK